MVGDSLIHLLRAKHNLGCTGRMEESTMDGVTCLSPCLLQQSVSSRALPHFVSSYLLHLFGE